MNETEAKKITDNYHHSTYGYCVIDYPYIEPFKFSAWNWNTHKWDKLMTDPRLPQPNPEETMIANVVPRSHEDILVTIAFCESTKDLVEPPEFLKRLEER